MADDTGGVQATVAEETKTVISVDVGGTVSDLSEVIASYEPGEYRFDPPKVLEAGRTYVLALLDDGRALLRLPYAGLHVEDLGKLADRTLGLAGGGPDDSVAST